MGRPRAADQARAERGRREGSLAPVSSFAPARFQWEEGHARVRAAAPRRRVVLERVMDATVAELRRRLGGPFTLDELVALHGEGTDWAQALAVKIAPDLPEAWEEQVTDAAFWRYAREARDFAGGRRRGEE